MAPNCLVPSEESPLFSPLHPLPAHPSHSFQRRDMKWLTLLSESLTVNLCFEPFLLEWSKERIAPYLCQCNDSFIAHVGLTCRPIYVHAHLRPDPPRVVAPAANNPSRSLEDNLAWGSKECGMGKSNLLSLVRAWGKKGTRAGIWVIYPCTCTSQKAPWNVRTWHTHFGRYHCCLFVSTGHFALERRTEGAEKVPTCNKEWSCTCTWNRERERFSNGIWDPQWGLTSGWRLKMASSYLWDWSSRSNNNNACTW